MNPISIGHVENAAITVLIDNKADLIVKSSDRVKYFKGGPLLAEHGFSAVIQLNESEKRILWDAGVSRAAVVENLSRMKIDTSSIEKIALSHGHADHFTGMESVLREMMLRPGPRDWDDAVESDEIENWLETQKVPIVMHPAATRERWWADEDGTMSGPVMPPPTQEWQEMGAKLVLSEGPTELAPGCWTTGYIPRKSFEVAGRPSGMRFRENAKFLHDDIEDDQAIVINVKQKGLVVLAGCAHSGIVNTVNYAREMSGIDRVHAVIGGFHLASSDDEEIERTVQAINELDPELIVPSHCTGLRAISRFAQEMPEPFVEGVVGATYLF